jgi:glycosyltransferase involved in cell wall biosynthesis
MKISFVIPAYNEEAVIAKCLESVQKELTRTPCEVEVVVVNNASTDKTREIALTFPGVRVVNEEKKGLVFARAAGDQRGTMVDRAIPHGSRIIVVNVVRSDENAGEPPETADGLHRHSMRRPRNGNRSKSQPPVAPVSATVADRTAQ